MGNFAVKNFNCSIYANFKLICLFRVVIRKKIEHTYLCSLKQLLSKALIVFALFLFSSNFYLLSGQCDKIKGRVEIRYTYDSTSKAYTLANAYLISNSERRIFMGYCDLVFANMSIFCPNALDSIKMYVDKNQLNEKKCIEDNFLFKKEVKYLRKANEKRVYSQNVFRSPNDRKSIFLSINIIGNFFPVAKYSSCPTSTFQVNPCSRDKDNLNSNAIVLFAIEKVWELTKKETTGLKYKKIKNNFFTLKDCK
jgi:hypothetical protein